MKKLLIVLLFGISGVAFAAPEVGFWSVQLSTGEAAGLRIEGIVADGEPLYGRLGENIEYHASSSAGRGQKSVVFIGHEWRVADIKEDANGISAVVSVTATHLTGMGRDVIDLPAISITTVELSVTLQDGVETVVAGGDLPVRLAITRAPQ